LESSYLIDATRSILTWSRAQEMAIIDLNLYPRALPPITRPSGDKPVPQLLEAAALLYIWDNYIELSDAKDVVIVAFGTACKGVISLLTERATRQKVKAVVHIVGHSNPMPTLAKTAQEDLKYWYQNASFTLMPHNHRQLPESTSFPRRYGNIVISQEETPIKAYIQHVPAVQTFILSRISAVDTIIR